MLLGILPKLVGICVGERWRREEGWRSKAKGGREEGEREEEVVGLMNLSLLE